LGIMIKQLNKNFKKSPKILPNLIKTERKGNEICVFYYY
jgi:hypothetical protein